MFSGEAALHELLAEPIVHRLMESDGVSMAGLLGILTRARGSLDYSITPTEEGKREGQPCNRLVVCS